MSQFPDGAKLSTCLIESLWPYVREFVRTNYESGAGENNEKGGCKLGKMRKWCISSSFKLMRTSKWGLFLPPHKIISCCWYNQFWPRSGFYSSVAPSGKHCNWLVGATISQVQFQQREEEKGIFMPCLALCSKRKWHKHLCFTINATKIKCSLASPWQVLCGLQRQVSTTNGWLTACTQLTFPTTMSCVQQ